MYMGNVYCVLSVSPFAYFICSTCFHVSPICIICICLSEYVCTYAYIYIYIVFNYFKFIYAHACVCVCIFFNDFIGWYE